MIGSLGYETSVTFKQFLLRVYGTNHDLAKCISHRIFDNVIAKWTFCVQQFYSAKNYL